MEKFEVFFSKEYYNKLLKAIQEQQPLIISLSQLEKFDSELSDYFLENPEESLKAMQESLSNVCAGEEAEKINIRIFDIPETEIVKIKDLRSSHISKFVGIEGIIKQASEVRPEITMATFECQGCGERVTLLQDKPQLSKPFKCMDCGNKRGFDLVIRKLVDIQRIVVEESPETLEGGAQPRKLPVFLSDDLVDPKFQKKVIPGNKVRINGIINDIPIKLEKGGESKRRDIYMDGNYLETIEKEFEEIEVGDKDIKKIKELAKNPRIYKLLTNSIAPSIYGYDKLKEAIVLQLFGGIRKVRPDGITIRGDIHVFLVGDPGTAKSQLLKYVSGLAPKARYVVGKSASGAGITATVVRDEFMRGWALEAGALVLANKGIAMIDELDKMSTEDRSAMHEVMEQQTVTISKANVQATLLAQTTILAAANPKFGRFDPYSSLAEQIDIPNTLLSRFDLIFTVRDVPNKDSDTRLARHILKSHVGKETKKNVLDSDLLRKYIAYTKANVKPKLTKLAEKEIQNFFVELRNKYSGEEIPTVPLSARQLESLIRLATASAKIRLSDKITKEDAKRAIDILTSCLKEVGVDLETGRFDIDKIESGITATQRNKIRIILELVSDLQAEAKDKTASIDDVLAAAEEEGITEAEEIINKLKRGGELFEPRTGFIRRV